MRKTELVYLQSVSALCNQMLHLGITIGANNAEATNVVSKTLMDFLGVQRQ